MNRYSSSDLKKTFVLYLGLRNQITEDLDIDSSDTIKLNLKSAFYVTLERGYIYHPNKVY